MYMLLIKILLFFYKISDLIAKSQEDHVIICGDFNLALDPSLDVNNYKAINNPKSRALLVNTMNDHNLTDTFRYFHQKTRRYTWRRKNRVQQARLNYIISTNSILNIINSCNIIPGYRSDHSIVEMKINS